MINSTQKSNDVMYDRAYNKEQDDDSMDNLLKFTSGRPEQNETTH